MGNAKCCQTALVDTADVPPNKDDAPCLEFQDTHQFKPVEGYDARDHASDGNGCKTADVTSSHIGYKALVAAFRQVDADGNGCISPKEMEHFLRYLGLAGELESARYLFQSMDSNGDNRIDLDEWLENLPSNVKDMIISKTDRKGALEGFVALKPLTDVFAQFDTDDSGSLSKNELIKALRCLGYTNASDVIQLVRAMDTNSDGEIDINEWKEYLPDEVRAAIESSLNSDGLVEQFVDNGEDRAVFRALFDDLEECGDDEYENHLHVFDNPKPESKDHYPSHEENVMCNQFGLAGSMQAPMHYGANSLQTQFEYQNGRHSPYERDGGIQHGQYPSYNQLTHEHGHIIHQGQHQSYEQMTFGSNLAFNEGQHQFLEQRPYGGDPGINQGQYQSFNQMTYGDDRGIYHGQHQSYGQPGWL